IKTDGPAFHEKLQGGNGEDRTSALHTSVERHTPLTVPRLVDRPKTVTVMASAIPQPSRRLGGLARESARSEHRVAASHPQDLLAPRQASEASGDIRVEELGVDRLHWFPSHDDQRIDADDEPANARDGAVMLTNPRPHAGRTIIEHDSLVIHAHQPQRGR